MIMTTLWILKNMFCLWKEEKKKVNLVPKLVSLSLPLFFPFLVLSSWIVILTVKPIIRTKLWVSTLMILDDSCWFTPKTFVLSPSLVCSILLESPVTWRFHHHQEILTSFPGIGIHSQCKSMEIYLLSGWCVGALILIQRENCVLHVCVNWMND